MKRMISFALMLCLAVGLLPAAALSDVSSANLALHKTASASTELGGYGAVHLTDGDVQSGWSPGTGVNHWGMVDLGQAYQLTRVVVEMRKDYNQPETRSGFEVRASNSPDMSNYIVLGAQGSTPIEHGGRFIVDVAGVMNYRYIQVIKTDGRYFFMNEIMVYGKEAADGGLATVPAFTDMTASADREDVELLTLLGVVEGYEDNTFRPEKQVTRVEACQLIVNLLGLGNQTATEQLFSDVPLSYWGAMPIEMLSGMGAVSGMGDGTFMPEEKVTYGQFIKLLLASLGYEYLAQENGGYPNGYFAMASMNDITLSGAGPSDIITRGMAARLLCMALDVNAAKPTGIRDGKLLYEIDKNETILNSVFGTERYRGKVQGTEFSALAGKARLGKGKIMIDDLSYRTAMDTSQILGRRVTYYVQTLPDTGEEVLLYFVPQNEDDVLMIPAESIALATQYEITYYEDVTDARSERADIDRLADVYYNEDYLPDWTAASLRPESGFVRLVDGDGDRRYDSVFVYAYETLVISNVSVSGKEVSLFGLYGNQKRFDMGDSGTRVRLTDKNGRSINPMAVEKGDVAAIYSSADDSFIWVAVSGDKREAHVSELTSDGVVADGEEMKYSPAYKQALATGSYGVKKAQLGVQTTFYLDIDGRIAAVSEGSLSDTTVTKYGYLVDVIKKGGIDETLLLLMADTNGALQEFTGSSGMKFNSAVASADDIISSLAATGHNGTYGQLIRYHSNAVGEITALFTTEELSEENGIRPAQSFTSPGAAEYYYHTPTVSLYKVSGAAGADYFVSGSTLMFTVPRYSAAAAGEMRNASHYSVTRGSGLANYAHYFAEGYNCDKAGVAEVLINYITPLSSDDGSTALKETHGPVLLVDSVVDAVDAEGEPAVKLHAWQNGQKVSFLIHEGVDTNRFKFIGAAGESYHALSRGDVIRCSVSGSTITSAIILFRAQEPLALSNGRSWDNESVYPPVTRTIAGVIKNIYGDYMEIAKGDPTAGIDALQTEKYDFTSSTTYLFDTGKNKISVISAMDIPLYTYLQNTNLRVFIRTSYGAAQLVLIIQ